MLILNDQQLEAVKACVEWYFTKTTTQQVFFLSGYSGTGKSTVVNIIIKMLGLPLQNVIFCTLTGKAALVLRMKGNPANTIHKTFYSTYKTRTSFGFSLKKHIPSHIHLIVIDEISMVTQKMLTDIMTFRVPILCCGDAGQLPAVGGNNYLMTEGGIYIDYQLTKVMRQDDTSGILDLGNMTRNNQLPEYGEYKASKVCHLTDVADKMCEYDIVLCYSNATRRKLNAYMRAMMGYTSILPVKGEKVVCLMNNYNYMIEYQDIPIYIINGMFGILKEDAVTVDYKDMELAELNFIPDFLDQNSQHLILKPKCFKSIFEQYTKDPSKEAFSSELYDDKIEDDALQDVCMIDFGYAASVHKYQGSEADNVLLVVEDKIPGNIFFRWLYTGITRAKKSITVATVS